MRQIRNIVLVGLLLAGAAAGCGDDGGEGASPFGGSDSGESSNDDGGGDGGGSLEDGAENCAEEVGDEENRWFDCMVASGFYCDVTAARCRESEEGGGDEVSLCDVFPELGQCS